MVPDWLDTELLGLGLDLNGVMLCDTPSARMNCSRNSTLVRPLASEVGKVSPQPTRGNRQTGEVVEVTRLGRCGTQSGAAQFRLRVIRKRMGRGSGW